MKTNRKRVVANSPRTCGGVGAVGSRITSEQELTRSVVSCLLFEDNAYEDGISTAQRIKDLVAKCDPEFVADLAYRARSEMHLRHIPLFLCRELARLGTLRRGWLLRCIQRVDEMGEFMSLYYSDNKNQPLAYAAKRDIADAFGKFSEYQFGKYKGAGKEWSLRDVMKFTHPRPRTVEDDLLYKKIISNTLTSPDTWEVALSTGANKREAFERLLREQKLGYTALLMNLRQMAEANVSETLIRQAILDRRGADRILPFRFITAAKYAPRFADVLSDAMIANMKDRRKLLGKTVLVVDVSGSMIANLSHKSEVTRLDAAAALAAIAREAFSECVVYATAGSDARRVHATEMVKPYRGLAMVDEIKRAYNSLGGGGIFLTQVCDHIRSCEKNVDRMLVVSDEQDCDIDPARSPLKAVPLGSKKNYFINVGVERCGISYNKNKWDRIDGFSESIFDYLFFAEQLN